MRLVASTAPLFSPVKNYGRFYWIFPSSSAFIFYPSHRKQEFDQRVEKRKSADYKSQTF